MPRRHGSNARRVSADKERRARTKSERRRQARSVVGGTPRHWSPTWQDPTIRLLVLVPRHDEAEA